MLFTARRFRKRRSKEVTNEMPRLTVERTADGLDEEWVVRREGAEALKFRLEQQMHWQQATAVRAGRQPPVDPDGAELVGIGEGVRVYRAAKSRARWTAAQRS